VLAEPQVVAFGGQMSTPQVDVELSQTLQRKNPQAVATTFDWQAGGGGSDTSFRGKSRSYIVDKPECSRALTSCKTLAVAFTAKDCGGDATQDVAPTMRAMGHSGSHANGGGQLAVAVDTYNQSVGDVSIPLRVGNAKDSLPAAMVAFAIDGGNQAASEEVHHSLRTGRDSGDAVAFKPSHYTRGKDGAPSEVTAPLSADADKGDQDTVVACNNTGAGWWNDPEEVAATVRRECDRASVMATAVVHPMAVRRLTPRECERLQGFPDDYTLVEYRKKPAADGPRYRALGNSMAVPVMRWIGERIAMVDKIECP
jgi:DNA (cytosine-5)-methyltransferase 1